MYWVNSFQNILWLRNHVVAPLSEEFTFRACMLPILLQSFHPTRAIMITPLFFGIAHLHHVIERYRAGMAIRAILIVSGQCSSEKCRLLPFLQFNADGCLSFQDFSLYTHQYLACTRHICLRVPVTSSHHLLRMLSAIIWDFLMFRRFWINLNHASTY